MHRQDTVSKAPATGDAVVVTSAGLLMCCYKCWKLYCSGEGIDRFESLKYRDSFCSCCFRGSGSKKGALGIVIDALTHPKECHEAWWPRVLIEIDGTLYAVESVRALE